MARDSFPIGVADQLKWYVDRLIDPRNGETFYVGKGQERSVYAHAKFRKMALMKCWKVNQGNPGRVWSIIQARNAGQNR